jgi:hypothetical protein
MHYLLDLERFKIYIKIHTKCRSCMFRSTTIIRGLVLNLAKVIFKLKHVITCYLVMWQHFIERSVCCVRCRMGLGSVCCVLCRMDWGVCVVRSADSPGGRVCKGIAQLRGGGWF